MVTNQKEKRILNLYEFFTLRGHRNCRNIGRHYTINKQNLQYSGKDWITSVPNLENEPSDDKISYEILQQTELYVQYKVNIIRYDGTTSNFTFKVSIESGDIIQ